MLTNKVGKFGEVAFLLQDLVPKLGLCHHSIEVRRNHVLKSTAVSTSYKKRQYRGRNRVYTQSVVVVIVACTEDFGEEDLDVHHILEITFLIKQP